MSYGMYLKSSELQANAAEIAAFSFDASDAAPMSALKSAAEKHLTRINRLGINATAPVPFKVSQFDILVSLADKTALLFNSRTRSLSLLTEQEARIYRTLAAGGPFTLSSVPNKVFLHTLADAGNICRMDFNELVLVKANYDAVRGDSKTLNLTIAPTMACNFACGYCYQGLDKPTKKMSIEIQDAILNFVKAKKDLGFPQHLLVWRRATDGQRGDIQDIRRPDILFRQKKYQILGDDGIQRVSSYCGRRIPALFTARLTSANHDRRRSGHA